MPGEPVEVCAKKCKMAFDAALSIMFAIEEKKEEREARTTLTACASQLMEPLAKILSLDDWKSVYAYIGSGDAQEHSRQTCPRKLPGPLVFSTEDP